MVINIILGLIIVGLVVYILKGRKKAPEKPKMNKEEKKKQEQIKKAFDNLMRYDFNTATRRK